MRRWRRRWEWIDGSEGGDGNARDGLSSCTIKFLGIRHEGAVILRHDQQHF